MNILLQFSRAVMIKRMRKKNWGNQRINTVLNALDLPLTGLPKYKAPPMPPKKIIAGHIKVTPEMLEDFKI